MEPKAGKKTTEFWVSLVISIASPIISILVARGVMAVSEGELWAELLAVMLPIIGLVISGSVAKNYTTSRTKVKEAAYQSQTEPVEYDPERVAKSLGDMGYGE